MHGTQNPEKAEVGGLGMNNREKNARLDCGHPPPLHFFSLFTAYQCAQCPCSLPSGEALHNNENLEPFSWCPLKTCIHHSKGGGGFCHLQPVLWWFRSIPLTLAVHTDMEYWHHLIASLNVRPTHMLDTILPDPSWFSQLTLPSHYMVMFSVAL